MRDRGDPGGDRVGGRLPILGRRGLGIESGEFEPFARSDDGDAPRLPARIELAHRRDLSNRPELHEEPRGELQSVESQPVRPDLSELMPHVPIPHQVGCGAATDDQQRAIAPVWPQLLESVGQIGQIKQATAQLDCGGG